MEKKNPAYLELHYQKTDLNDQIFASLNYVDYFLQSFRQIRKNLSSLNLSYSAIHEDKPTQNFCQSCLLIWYFVVT